MYTTSRVDRIERAELEGIISIFFDCRKKILSTKMKRRFYFLKYTFQTESSPCITGEFTKMHLVVGVRATQTRNN